MSGFDYIWSEKVVYEYIYVNISWDILSLCDLIYDPVSVFRSDPKLFRDDIDIKFSRTLNSCKVPQVWQLVCVFYLNSKIVYL